MAAPLGHVGCDHRLITAISAAPPAVIASWAVVIGETVTRLHGSLAALASVACRSDNGTVLYDDGRIACGDDAITIRWYYLWGAKRMPYRRIRSVEERALSAVRGRWRIWGSGDLVHWYNLDPTRSHKDVALVLDVGGRVKPTITPDDPAQVRRIVDEHIA